MKFLPLLVMLFANYLNLSGQNVGIGTSIPHASAAVEIKAANKGLLMPRTSTASRIGIADPAKGLMLYDSTIGSFWYYNGSAWEQLSSNANSWSTTGNVVTNPALHFIGTTDVSPIVFKVNNIKAGIIDSTTNNTAIGFRGLDSVTSGTHNAAFGYKALNSTKDGYANTALGSNALRKNTSGLNNTATGMQSLTSNTDGSSNTGIGNASLFANSSGSNNTAIGTGALFANISADNNTSIGYQSLNSNTTGYSNVAVGVGALHVNSTKSNLVAVGDSALYNNGAGAVNPTDATGNTAVGSKALFSNTIGAQNTATGYRALYTNTAGNYNSSFGYLALFNNGTGAVNPDDASRNTAIGNNAMFSNSTGGYNTALGFAALSANTTGYFNCAIGYTSLGANVSGFENAALGLGAGSNAVNNSYCTFLGNRTNTTFNLTNATAIGYNAIVNASNKIRLGNNGVTVIEGAASYTVSDGRFKQDVSEDVPGLDFITSLRPVTYRYKSFELDQFLQEDNSKSPSELKHSDYSQAESMVHLGFIAQEVEELIKEKKYTLSFVKPPSNPRDNYSMAYGELIAPLVKAVQEQQMLIKALQKENAQLKAMQTDIDMLKAAMLRK